MTDTSSTPVFRSIVLDNGVTITLGQQPSPEAWALMKHKPNAPPNVYELKPGTYKRAREIDVLLGAGDVVQQMDFIYAADAHCREMVADFESELGPPTSQHDEITQWRDPATLFQLVCLPAGVRSFLRDLAPNAS